MQILDIKFLQSAASKYKVFKKGEIYSLPLKEAKSFLYAKLAIPVKKEKEKAILTTKETRNVQVSNSGKRRPNKPSRSKTVSKGNA